MQAASPHPSPDRMFHLTLDRHLRASPGPLLDLVKLWYLRRGADGLPERSAFDAPALKTVLPHIFIAEYEPAAQRYRYRLIGTAITEAFGRNATGRYFDELYAGADLRSFCAMLDAARQGGEPRSVSGKAVLPDRAGFNLECLLLPVSVAAGHNPQIVGAIYFPAGDTLARDLRQVAAAYSAA